MMQPQVVGDEKKRSRMGWETGGLCFSANPAPGHFPWHKTNTASHAQLMQMSITLAGSGGFCLGLERKPCSHRHSNSFRQMFSAVTQARSEFSQNFISTPASTGHPAIVHSGVGGRVHEKQTIHGTKNRHPRTVPVSGLKNGRNRVYVYLSYKITWWNAGPARRLWEEEGVLCAPAPPRTPWWVYASHQAYSPVPDSAYRSVGSLLCPSGAAQTPVSICEIW